MRIDFGQFHETPYAQTPNKTVPQTPRSKATDPITPIVKTQKIRYHDSWPKWRWLFLLVSLIILLVSIAFPVFTILLIITCICWGLYENHQKLKKKDIIQQASFM